jgi:hypothetical protein
LPQPNQYRREDSYYSFINRSSGLSSDAPIIPVGFSSFNSSAGLNFALAADQAMKLVSADAEVFDSSSSGSIILLNAVVAADPRATVQGRQYGLSYGGIPVLAVGQTIHVTDEEWFFWNDYMEQGGSVGPMNFSLSIDVHNTSAAPIQIGLFLGVIVELYEKQKILPSLADRTLRTLREIPE